MNLIKDFVFYIVIIYALINCPKYIYKLWNLYILEKPISEDEKQNIQFTDQQEQIYRNVLGYYERARETGKAILIVALQATIALVTVPIFLFDNINKIFTPNIGLVYKSWIFIILSVAFGFVSLFFVFEGYYHQAHYETSRKYYPHAGFPIIKAKKYNMLFDLSHWFAMFMVISFCVALIILIGGIIMIPPINP